MTQKFGVSLGCHGVAGLLGLVSLTASGAAGANPPSGALAGKRDWNVTPDGELVLTPRKPVNEPDAPKAPEPQPEKLREAAASADAGALLPMTLTPIVGSQSSLALVLGGYDGGSRGALVDSQVEATVWGPIAVRAGISYDGALGASFPFAGARVQLLHQLQHGIDLGFAGFYKPQDFRAEGNIVAALSLARRFDRVALFASTAFESDPEGDDRLGDLRTAALYRCTERLQAGAELRYRHDLGSNDPKRAGHSEPVFDFRLAPLLEYSLGPLALIAESGLALAQTQNGIDTARERSSTRVGVLAIGGLGGAL
jgi:hypothetical protein